MTISEDTLRLIQSAGIIISATIGIGALWIGAINARATARATQVRNLLDLTEAHRDIWRRYQAQPELRRVLEWDSDPEAMSDSEYSFLREIILHLAASFEASRAGVLAPLEGMSLDVRNFMARPLPRAVWIKLRPYQNAAFRDFVEEQIAEAEREVDSPS